jgi:hypothetical protein
VVEHVGQFSEFVARIGPRFVLFGTCGIIKSFSVQAEQL